MDKWQIMRHEVSRQFARRLVQEAEMSDHTDFYVGLFTTMQRVEQERENARALISRMCAAPLVIQYEEDDELEHTDAHPFCNDPDCPCHFDPEEGWNSCWGPYMAGLFTPQEATRFWQGRQV